MNKITEKDLNVIYGGSNTISGPLINGITNIIKILYEAGKSAGSSIRRMQEGNLCPVK